jgi:hypothetical protein
MKESVQVTSGVYDKWHISFAHISNLLRTVDSTLKKRDYGRKGSAALTTHPQKLELTSPAVARSV